MASPLDILVAASLDDAHNYSTSTFFDGTGNSTNIGDYAGGSYYGAFRFLNVTIPVGATINVAYITFTSYANQSGATCNVNCYGENPANANPATYSTYADLAGRTMTTAVTAWNAVGAWVAETTYNSPSLVNQVTEMIANANWASGQAMAFQFRNNGSSTNAVRQAYSYNASATKCAVLHIEYSIAHTKFISDTIAIVDNHAANIGVIKSDTITIADVLDFLKTITLFLSDSITISDSFSKVSEFKRSISDLVALTDTLTRAVEFNRSIADSVAIADVISKEFRLPRGEAIAIADTLVKAVGLNKFDTASIADLFAKVSAFAPALADTVSINDVISKAVGVVKADIITITEGLQRIIGSANVSVDDTVGTDFFRLSKFTAEASGNVVQIRIYSEGSLSVKIAMYEDNAGEPGDLMNAVNVAQAVVTGWNLIAFPATAVVLGTDYWLAFNSG